MHLRSNWTKETRFFILPYMKNNSAESQWLKIEFGAQKQELLVFWDGLTTRVRAKVHQDALQHLVYFVHIRKKRKKTRREKIVGLIFFYLFIIKFM